MNKPSATIEETMPVQIQFSSSLDDSDESKIIVSEKIEERPFISSLESCLLGEPVTETGSKSIVWEIRHQVLDPLPPIPHFTPDTKN